MSQSWEDFKKEKQKEFGTDEIEIIKPIIKETIVHKEPKQIALYEIRKVTLPPSKEHGKIVVYGVTSKEADWWLEKKLKPKVFHDDDTETKTLVFYEKFLIGGTPKERNIYTNPARFCTEDFPELNTPRRIN